MPVLGQKSAGTRLPEIVAEVRANGLDGPLEKELGLAGTSSVFFVLYTLLFSSSYSSSFPIIFFSVEYNNVSAQRTCTP